MFDSFAKSLKNHGFSSNEDSGVCSPQLWRVSHENNHGKHYRCLSPASKAEAVARGERELMEMASKMPESCYELSLKDLVEVNQDIQKSLSDDTNQDSEIKQIRVKKTNDKRAQVSRNGSANNEGFLLKMAFPFNFGSKKAKKKIKKKKIDSCASNGPFVSPRLSAASESPPGNIITENWWKKRVSRMGEKENTISKTRSTRSNGSSIGHNCTGCLSFVLIGHFGV